MTWVRRLIRWVIGENETEMCGPEIDENSFREGYEWGYGDGSTSSGYYPDQAHKAIVEMYALGLKESAKAINRHASEASDESR